MCKRKKGFYLLCQEQKVENSSFPPFTWTLSTKKCRNKSEMGQAEAATYYDELKAENFSSKLRVFKFENCSNIKTAKIIKKTQKNKSCSGKQFWLKSVDRFEGFSKCYWHISLKWYNSSEKVVNEWLDSNHESLAIEATALPTAPQPLPNLVTQ